ncbi:S-locus glycoprotein domain [Sesbania bispinosa]|nr:S-locus glycoprotein domain [Sesbania bispinosa]
MLEQECLLRSALLLCVFVGFLLHPVVTTTIPLGSKLTVVDNNCWVSSNGDFAFGFFNISDEPNQFSAGIHFNSKSIPYSQQTVVWIAGAHVTVSNSSYFQLTQEGELVLFDSFQGVTAWTSGTGNQSVVSAVLQDNGNLILRASSKNPMSSYYSLYMNASGQLELRWESNIIYWTSESPSNTSNLTAFLTAGGALQLRDQSLKAVWSVFGEDHNDSVNYRFLRLDLDGNLRIYSWIETSQSWRSVWQAVENQCKVFATCGQRGVCVFTDSGSADCSCPFEVTETNKCLVPYEEECKSGSNMITYKNTYLYGIYPPDDSVIISSLQQCEQLCQNDPQCTVATFSNNGSPQCSIKKTKYITGYADPSLSTTSFVKRCSGPFAVNPSLMKPLPPKPPSKDLCFLCNGSNLRNISHLCYAPAGNWLNCVILLGNQEHHWGSQESNWAKHVQGCATKQSPDCSKKPECIHRGKEVPECCHKDREHPPQEPCEAGGLLLEFVSHGNLKCENVILDENSVAKVTEYGFAIVNGEATYCGFSAEKDVRDFGKLVLTLLTGCRDHEELCEWTYKEWAEGRAGNVVDKRIDGDANSEELERALRIAFWCLQMDERRRPSMEEVVRVLEGTLNVDPPPPPFAFNRPLQEDDDSQEIGSE